MKDELERLRQEMRNQTTHVRFQHRAMILLLIIAGLLFVGVPLLNALTGGR